MRSIQIRLNNVEVKLNIDNESVFIHIENRNGKRGITLSGNSDERFSFPKEVETSPRWNNVIEVGENSKILLWRSKHFTLNRRFLETTIDIKTAKTR